MRKLILVFSTIAILSCSGRSYNKNELIAVLNGNNRDSVIDAIKFIKKQKDTSLIPYLLKNAADPRISHRASSYGRSVYNLKMNAIRSMTGISPSINITDKPDSAVIKFYMGLYLKNRE